MAHRWRRLTVLLMGASLLVSACSSSRGRPSASSLPSVLPSPSSSAVQPPASSPPSAEGPAAQPYLDSVNRLCDALLPKVIAVTHGGSLDIPVKDYLAQQPAHAKLLADFDRQLALVPVPPTAADKAAAFAAYVR